MHDLKDQLSDEEQIEFLGIANSETDRLTRLVNDVLDLSRLESGKIVQLEQMDIKPAIEQTLRNYRLNASEKNVSLAHDIEETIPPILGNFDLLLQVLCPFVLVEQFSQTPILINLIHHLQVLLTYQSLNLQFPKILFVLHQRVDVLNHVRSLHNF